MTDQQACIDRILVHLFNDILRIEEDALHAAGVHGLSMREVHLLQAIQEAGESNTMSDVAARQRVTMGSLTVAVNTLERKGYVSRLRSPTDKRRIHVCLTEKATEVDRIHRDFHHNLTNALIQEVPPQQLALLCDGLNRVSDYFYRLERKPNT